MTKIENLRKTGASSDGSDQKPGAQDAVQPQRITDELDALIELRARTERELDRLNRHPGLIERIIPFRTSTS